MSLFANYQRQANSIAQGRLQTAEQLAQSRGSMYSASASAAAQTLTEGEVGSEINLGKKMATKFAIKGGLKATLEGTKLIADNSNLITKGAGRLVENISDRLPGSASGDIVPPSATEAARTQDLNERFSNLPEDEQAKVTDNLGSDETGTYGADDSEGAQKASNDMLEDEVGKAEQRVAGEGGEDGADAAGDAAADAGKAAGDSAADAASDAAKSAADAASQAAEKGAEALAKTAGEDAAEMGGEAAAGTIGAAVGGALSSIIPVVGWGVGLYTLISGGMDLAKEIKDDPEKQAQKLVNQSNSKVAAAEAQVSSDQFQSRIGAQAPSFGSLAAAGARAQQSIALHD